jgi:myo-inositol-1(or 4)-monophosphatase
MDDPHRMLALLNAAADAVRDAVEALPIAIRRRRAAGHPDQFELDIAADRAVRGVLADGGVGILSEESGRSGPRHELVVVVDPVDGSTNCSRGTGFYGPSLCAVDSGGPLAAVVMNLSTNRRYTAVRGMGAAVNGTWIESSNSDDIALIATGDPCPYLERFPSAEVRPIYTRLSGASAHDLCLVADGTYDGYVDCVNTQSLWDYLGASLVLTEACGVLRERRGADLTDLSDPGPRQIIAARSGRQLAALSALVERTHTTGAASH